MKKTTVLFLTALLSLFVSRTAAGSRLFVGGTAAGSWLFVSRTAADFRLGLATVTRGLGNDSEIEITVLLYSRETVIVIKPHLHACVPTATTVRYNYFSQKYESEDMHTPHSRVEGVFWAAYSSLMKFAPKLGRWKNSASVKKRNAVPNLPMRLRRDYEAAGLWKDKIVSIAPTKWLRDLTLRTFVPT